MEINCEIDLQKSLDVGLCDRVLRLNAGRLCLRNGLFVAAPGVFFQK